MPAFVVISTGAGISGGAANWSSGFLPTVYTGVRPSFARACLLARRMVQRGVRFINIYHEGWDAHSDVVGNHKGNLKAIEQATVALVQDLKRLGMLDSTLVIWGGEFGRTPMIESNASLWRANGRDHHLQAYMMWMAGGGTKAGFQYGKTDDLGFHDRMVSGFAFGKSGGHARSSKATRV